MIRSWYSTFMHNCRFYGRWIHRWPGDSSQGWPDMRSYGVSSVARLYKLVNSHGARVASLDDMMLPKISTLCCVCICLCFSRQAPCENCIHICEFTPNKGPVLRNICTDLFSVVQIIDISQWRAYDVTLMDITSFDGVTAEWTRRHLHRYASGDRC